MCDPFAGAMYKQKGGIPPYLDKPSLYHPALSYLCHRISQPDMISKPDTVHKQH
jgi:hypothetical protein